MIGAIPFEAIQAAALRQADTLLRQWLPNGRIRGREFEVGNLQGDAGDSLKVNLATGLWSDFADGPSGHDLIDLFAEIAHRGDRVAAARELGAMLGITTHNPASNGHSQLADQRPQVDQWQPMVPPPPDGGSPPAKLLVGFDVVHEYTAADDQVTHYVGRIEARGDQRKQFVPVTYGVLNGALGWHRKAPASPLALYGLNRLATMPDATVLLCEGEKAADAAEALFPGFACLSYFGGTGRVDHADLAPLQGREVVIWPDNDTPGAEAARKLQKRLPQARLLRVDDLGDGHDAADVRVDDPEVWLDTRLPPDPAKQMRDFLSIEAWATREIPPPDRLLGDLVTSTSRSFLVGRTGLGKTMFGLALAVGMASGEGFLHWRSSRPARVLYLDGEMPGELIKARAVDALRRADSAPDAGNLLIYGRDLEEEMRRGFPSISTLAPLNTGEGQDFVLGLIAAVGGVDVVIFDNVMSLLAGNQKEEDPWSDTLPLIATLTGRRVGQIWLDHTGHATDRQYGSSTKSWRFDSVGIMTPLPDDQREPREVAFSLSFEAPGKARRRTPENWNEFEQCIIRLRDDRWTSEVAGSITKREKVSPKIRLFHDALVDAIGRPGTLHPGRATRAEWIAECVRRGVIDPPDEGDTRDEKNRKLAPFRKAISELLAAKWIGASDDIFTNLVQ